MTSMKLILIGDPGVGKTSLKTRFTNDIFQTTWNSTIEPSFSPTPDAKLPPGAKATIWDASGTERLRPNPVTFFAGAAGAVLVFDVTQKHTLENCENWLTLCREHGIPTMRIILVANKTDLPNRAVDKKVAEDFASKNRLLCIETSALNRTNVDQVFQELVRAILKGA